MIRIYLTEDYVEGYNEGCACCSSKEKASMSDIDELLEDLSSQIKNLRELKSLIQKYGEDSLVFWNRIFRNIVKLENAVDAASKYCENPNISGTYFKESFDDLEKNVEMLNDARNIFSKVPLRFKNFVGYK